MRLIVYVDGGARGNPGPAGAGVSISSDDGKLIHEAAYFLGRQTNNAAEYHALIRALRRVERYSGQTIALCSDSELLVRQITGEYRVKSPKLAQLFEQVQLLLLKIPCWNIRHVSRDENRRADQLANLAIDQRRDVIVFDADSGAGEAGAALAAAPSGPGVAPDQPAAEGDADPPAAAAARQPPDAAGPGPEGARAARVTLAKAPRPEGCPAGESLCQSFIVESTLPAGLCIHAAHALLPTVLAILNTEPAEFAAVPTLTVRCMRPECGATFHVSPTRSSNGVAKHNAQA
ncbi:MAG: ribonuclease HI family protein [Phycisphaerae bacterium]